MTIRYILAFVLFLSAQWSLRAQKDTLYQTTREETGVYTAPVIETPSDRIFRTQVPARWMFKLDLGRSLNFGNSNNLSPNPDGFPVGLGLEYKISPAFSAGINYSLNIGHQPSNYFSEGGWLYSSALYFEGRWYHDMKKRMQAGRSANNFGGRYLSAEVGLTNNGTLNSSQLFDTKRLALRYGLQQRFLRHGFFDISLGMGVADVSPILKRNLVFSTDQRVSIGLAAFRPKKTLSSVSGDLCDVLRCQDEQYKMLKINLFNVVNFQTNNTFYSIDLNPSIMYEQKIGRSPFSVELNAEFAYSNSKYFIFDGQGGEYNYKFVSANWNAAGELRWYYNMRKRILQGRSGNNLSGPFLAWQLQRVNLIPGSVKIFTDGNPNYPGTTVFGDYWAQVLLWGIQQRLFDRGFIQFKIGAGNTFGGNDYRYEGAGKPLTKISRIAQLHGLADLKVGVAF